MSRDLPVRPTIGDSSWFVRDRFGMFIHWGLYSLAARGSIGGTQAEWIQFFDECAAEDYARYSRRFDPDLYDPRLWASAASGAGMKYAVLTTKHHDGFCLWDSAHTSFKATNTPARRDLVRPFVEACRERDLRIGFYHSLIDWNHPDFSIDSLHPLRNHPQRPQLNQKRDQRMYARYLHEQIRELLTGFGRIDLLWLDLSYKNWKLWMAREQWDHWEGKGRGDWESERLDALIRELQPHILVNDRLDLPDRWDFKTPEQHQPDDWPAMDGQRIVWESCQTFGGSWGYQRDESANWKTARQILQLLIDSVSKGGNLLLNVAPTGRGELDERTLSHLSEIGRWMRHHNRSIYGCTRAPMAFSPPANCLLTFNPQFNRIYIHLLAWPAGQLRIGWPLEGIEYAQLLNDASELRLSRGLPSDIFGEEASPGGCTVLELPTAQPETPIPVIELFLKDSP